MYVFIMWRSSKYYKLQLRVSMLPLGCYTGFRTAYSNSKASTTVLKRLRNLDSSIYITQPRLIQYCKYRAYGLKLVIELYAFLCCLVNSLNIHHGLSEPFSHSQSINELIHILSNLQYGIMCKNIFLHSISL